MTHTYPGIHKKIQPTEAFASKRENIRQMLEQNYKVDINTTDKILSTHLDENFLPTWDLYSKSIEEITEQIFIISQLLDANMEYLEHVSDDGKAITYYLNVGRNVPGRMAKRIEENIDMDIAAYDSIYTSSGIRIITIEKRGRSRFTLTPEDIDKFKILINEIHKFGKENQHKHTDEFLETLSTDYLKEEINSISYPSRVCRHQQIYEEVIGSKKIYINLKDTTHEINNEQRETEERRVSVAGKNPDKNFILQALNVFKENNINMIRSYYDSFENKNHDKVGILTLYLNSNIDLSDTLEALSLLKINTEDRAGIEINTVNKKLESIIRILSAPGTPPDIVKKCMSDIRTLVKRNGNLKINKETKNFLLNSYTDFMEALSFLKLDRKDRICKLLMGFDAFDEFFVSSKINGRINNKPGFRTKHNAARGRAYKGGLRIDPIVEFTEVAALSFMMTWKCARSKILFGGGKGGLMLNPKEFTGNKIDFFDTLTNFGRSLFLVTGPSLDVPAGDVGCGGEEIEDMFEGFKSALRDLALMVYGIKRVDVLIGNKVISIEHARKILKENFDIDTSNSNLLKEIITSEKYLELVAAPQITGKPRMGISARTGATGRGLCYSILAAVTRKYLDDEWKIKENLNEKEKSLLVKASKINEDQIIKNNGINLLTDSEWRTLNNSVFKKLLKGKKIVVQGLGKVGSAILRDLSNYDVNVIAVSNSRGAIIGNQLDVDELLQAVRDSSERPDRSKRNAVMAIQKNVVKKIIGAKEGAVILELECDILIPSALENAITAENAHNIETAIVACGSNGTNTSRAEKILRKKGVTVIYDFLANSAGVTASYFEWLRNLTERFRYEAIIINKTDFDIDVMDPYLMPEFKDRIKNILMKKESDEVTQEWNMILRDSIFSSINEDYQFAANNGVSMKTAGFINTALRVLTAILLNMREGERNDYWKMIPNATRELMLPFFRHPEAELLNRDACNIIENLSK